MKVNVLMSSFIITMSMAASAAMATYRVRVIDGENETPIKDVEVYGGFVMGSRGWDNTPPANVDTRLTDSDGMCRLRGNTDKGESYFGMSKRGYYKSERGEVKFSGHSILKLGRWVPDDIVVTARLDRVISPVPLYVKYVGGVVSVRKRKNSMFISDEDFKEIVSTNKTEFSYDLVKGDWLPPYGNGVRADISAVCWKEFICTKSFETFGGSETRDYYCSYADIVFNGDGNGVYQIKRHPHAGIKIRAAPENGYETTSIHRWYNTFGERNNDQSRSYAFRIRTEKDSEGKVKSALYGKVYWDFRVNYMRGVAFLYYLNPTPNDRNLEFDCKKNLNTADKCWPNEFYP